MEEAFVKASEGPTEMFGRLIGLGVICFFLDATGWITMFLSGRFAYLLGVFLQIGWTVCIIGIAALAILGSVRGYRHQEALKKLRSQFPQE